VVYNNVNTNTSAEATLEVDAVVPPTLTQGFVTVDRWEGLDNSTGLGGLDVLRAAILAGPPTVSSYRSAIDVPDLGIDNFGSMLWGWLKPDVTGDYNFFIRSDDSSALYINAVAAASGTNTLPDISDPAAAIVNETGCCAAFLEPAAAANGQTTGALLAPAQTGPIPLEAGKLYGFVVIYKEGTGGDFVQLAWRLTTDTTPAVSLRPIPGANLVTMASPSGQRASITTQPTPTTAVSGKTASFSVAARTTPVAGIFSVQWLKNGTAIPGATGTSYTTPVLSYPTDDGAKFKVRVFSLAGPLDSDEVTLTVLPDTFPPRPVTVDSVNATYRVVEVTFDGLLDKTSAETGANYLFRPGNIAGASASLAADGITVTITTASSLIPNVNNVLTITGVKDLAGNTAAANTTISFRFSPVTYADNILFDGPLGFYRFEESSGSVARNSGTTGGDGAYYTGDEAVPGEGGVPTQPPFNSPGPRPPTFVGFAAANRAATFTGPASYGGTEEWVDTKNQFLNHLGAFSLEYWVLPTDRQNQGTRIGIVGQNDAVEYGFININTIQIWTPGGSLDTAYSFPDGEWHHIATIATGTEIRNYYDGVFVNSNANTPTTDYGSSTYNVHIGGSGVFDVIGNYFIGSIDEVAIFNKAIPASRIAAHYKAGKEGGVITTSGAVTPALNYRLTASLSGNTLTVSWTPAGGTLQSTPAFAGAGTTWTDVGTANPATITVGTGNTFYRVKQ
jgi:hypothetical protein